MRTFARVLVATVVVGGLLVSSAHPAGAHPDVCAAQAVAETENRLYYPTLGPATDGHIASTFAIGGCLVHPHHGSVLILTFAVSPIGNYCGAAAGTGWFWHHTFDFTWVGNLVVFTGGVVGVADIEANAFVDSWCMEGAKDFLVTGVMLLVDPLSATTP